MEYLILFELAEYKHWITALTVFSECERISPCEILLIKVLRIWHQNILWQAWKILHHTQETIKFVSIKSLIRFESVVVLLKEDEWCVIVRVGLGFRLAEPKIFDAYSISHYVPRQVRQGIEIIHVDGLNHLRSLERLKGDWLIGNVFPLSFLLISILAIEGAVGSNNYRHIGIHSYPQL